MKTLKLQLLAASMFACTAAFAQGSQNAAPLLTPTPTRNQDAAFYAKGGAATPPSNSESFNSNRGGYLNDSYVLQKGNSQYAEVNQRSGAAVGGSEANQADIIQGQNGGAKNNAFQTQEYTGTAGSGSGKNKAYINQDGFNGTATQIQTGNSNVASINQSGGGEFEAGNTAYQNQNGARNRAGITQVGTGDQAIQFQMGSDNYSTIDQRVASPSRAESQQNGTNNAAIITQR